MCHSKSSIFYVRHMWESFGNWGLRTGGQLASSGGNVWMADSTRMEGQDVAVCRVKGGASTKGGLTVLENE